MGSSVASSLIFVGWRRNRSSGAGYTAPSGGEKEIAMMEKRKREEEMFAKIKEGMVKVKEEIIEREKEQEWARMTEADQEGKLMRRKMKMAEQRRRQAEEETNKRIRRQAARKEWEKKEEEKEAKREQEEWERWKVAAKAKHMEEYRVSLAALQKQFLKDWEKKKAVEWEARRSAKERRTRKKDGEEEEEEAEEKKAKEQAKQNAKEKVREKEKQHGTQKRAGTEKAIAPTLIDSEEEPDKKKWEKATAIAKFGFPLRRAIAETHIDSGSE